MNYIKQRLIVIGYDIWDWAQCLQQKYKSVCEDRAGGLALPSPCRRVAIISTWPNENSLPFFLNLLDGLAANGYFILAISTRPLKPTIAQAILAKCHRLVERVNVGRDFGTYKFGLRWVEQQDFYKDVEWMAFINDSLYYPRSITKTISDLMEAGAQEKWLALFECYAGRYHVQSFFQIFQREIFTSKAFKDFWESYYCLTSRIHNVEKGESELSNTLVGASYFPYTYYNTMRVHQDLLSRLKDDPDAKDRMFRYVLYMTMNRINRSWRDALPSNRFEDSLKLDPFDIAHKISILFEYEDSSQAVGLLCNWLYHAPLKRSRRVFTMPDTLSLCQGFTPEEMAYIAKDMRYREVPPYSWKIQEVLRRFERI